MTDSVAEDMLLSYFERWERLEGEKDAISADLRELFAEMKGHGFDTKVARKVFRDKQADSTERAEFEAVYDLYWSALSGPRAGRARIREEFEPQPETAEQSRLVVGTLSADAQFFTSFAGTEGDEGQQPNYGLAGPAYARDDEVANTKPALNSNPASTSPQISLAGEGSSNPQHTPAAPLDNPADEANEFLGGNANVSAGATAGETATKRQWTYADEPDPRCMNPIGCGGTSRFALCGKCKVKAGLANAEAVE